MIFQHWTIAEDQYGNEGYYVRVYAAEDIDPLCNTPSVNQLFYYTTEVIYDGRI